MFEFSTQSFHLIALSIFQSMLVIFFCNNKGVLLLICFAHGLLLKFSNKLTLCSHFWSWNANANLLVGSILQSFGGIAQEGLLNKQTEGQYYCFISNLDAIFKFFIFSSYCICQYIQVLMDMNSELALYEIVKDKLWIVPLSGVNQTSYIFLHVFYEGSKIFFCAQVVFSSCQ